jgi:tRNA nucleotidyltransferase/poly(A) polymerase
MMPFETHPQWKAVYHIHQNLKLKGFRSLIAGGAVRDLLLGRTPNDIDLATNATPEQVDEIFNKTVMVGKAFGVSRVIVDEHDIEVATFRKDGPYKNGRSPESVEYSSEEEDAKRRDFTINAMFYDLEKSEVLDYVGGQQDIMRKVLTTVGDPMLRFEEDKLRILRALRFHGQLSFTIDPKTAQAIRRFSKKMDQVSMERIRDEWIKLLVSENAVSALQQVYDLGLWEALFSPWSFQMDSYKQHFNGLPQDLDSAWILWFLIHHPESPEDLARLGLHWKLTKVQIQKMVYCLRSLPQLRNIQKIDAVDLAIFMGKPNGRLAVDIYKELYKTRLKKNFLDKLQEAETFFSKDKLPSLLVSGDDLIQYGLAPGPEIATQLKELYRIQLLENIHFKEELMSKIKS